jgi:hypothetical protein
MLYRYLLCKLRPNRYSFLLGGFRLEVQLRTRKISKSQITCLPIGKENRTPFVC